MIQKIIILVAATLLFARCGNVQEEPELFTEIVLAESEVFINGEDVQHPRTLLIVKDYLVVGNFKVSPMIEIYSLSSGKLLNKFLHQGKGRFEMLTVGSIQYIRQNEELLVGDLHRRYLYAYKYEDLLNPESVVPKVLYKIGENTTLLFDKLFSGKEYLIAESRDSKGRLLLLDKKGNESGYFLSYPDKKEIDEKLSDLNNADLYASAVTVSPSLNKIALATYSAGMIDICRIEKDKIVPEWNYIDFYPQGIVSVPMGDKIVVAHTSKSRSGFTNISSTDKYIYALYSGKLMEDKTYPYGNEVYVVSWDGEETYKIKLDKSINRLAVDPNDEFIYGITPELDIIKFSIPK